MILQNPEQLARQKIDRLLTEAGWVLQDRNVFDRNAALGVAVREFPLPAGHCDYLLFVGGKAAGVIEAKKTGVTLSGVADQSEKYALRPPEHLARWDELLIYHYESTGEETFFRNLRDPKARSRRLFAFHRPETLHDWLRQPETLRARLRHMPPLDTKGLRDCQIEAITGLEGSLAEDKPRSLIQLATGAGKTFTACSFSYRLIKEAGAKRILFLVDRNNLGDQTLREFQGFQPPGAANRFTDTYIVQHLHSHRIDPDAKVVITTIQRLYSILRGQELSEDEEEGSGFERWQGEDGEPLPLAYNPDIPIETFDFIVTDECHRSIYGLWRQVLEYFDASIIGLTATPGAAVRIACTSASRSSGSQPACGSWSSIISPAPSGQANASFVRVVVPSGLPASAKARRDRMRPLPAFQKPHQPRERRIVDALGTAQLPTIAQHHRDLRR